MLQNHAASPFRSLCILIRQLFDSFSETIKAFIDIGNFKGTFFQFLSQILYLFVFVFVTEKMIQNGPVIHGNRAKLDFKKGFSDSRNICTADDMNTSVAAALGMGYEVFDIYYFQVIHGFHCFCYMKNIVLKRADDPDSNNIMQCFHGSFQGYITSLALQLFYNAFCAFYPPHGVINNGAAFCGGHTCINILYTGTERNAKLAAVQHDIFIIHFCLHLLNQKFCCAYNKNLFSVENCYCEQDKQ